MRDKQSRMLLRSFSASAEGTRESEAFQEVPLRDQVEQQRS